MRRRRDKVREELAEMIKNRIIEEITCKLTATGEFERAVNSIVNGDVDPYTACDNLLLGHLGC